MAQTTVDLEPFRDLIAKYRKRAEVAAELKADYDNSVGEFRRTSLKEVARRDAARLEGKRQAYQSAADDLEKLIRELELPSTGGI